MAPIIAALGAERNRAQPIYSSAKLRRGLLGPRVFPASSNGLSQPGTDAGSVSRTRSGSPTFCALDDASRPEEMNLPGFRFHALVGRDKGRYAVSASGNWRMTFGWIDGDAIDVDLEDYH